MDALWFWIILLLLLITIAMFPRWPTYSGAPGELSWSGPSFWASLSMPR